MSLFNTFAQLCRVSRHFATIFAKFDPWTLALEKKGRMLSTFLEGFLRTELCPFEILSRNKSVVPIPPRLIHGFS